MKNLLLLLLLALSLPSRGQVKKLTTDDSLRAAFGHYYTYVCPDYRYKWDVKPHRWVMYLLHQGKAIDSIQYYPKLAMYKTKQWQLYIDVPNYISVNFPINCHCFTPR